MVKCFERRFNSSLLASNPKVKFAVLETSDRVEVDAASEGDDARHVYSMVANNEKLPYPNEVFDCYIASYSLHLVSNYKNMLSEAYRVTKKGGTVVFSTNRKAMDQAFNFLILEAMSKAGIESPGMHTADDSLADPEHLKSVLEEAGF